MTIFEDPPALFDLSFMETQPCALYAAPRQEAWTEFRLQGLTEELCRFWRCRFHHCRDARLCDGNGYPDLIIVGAGGVLFRELKLSGRKPSFEQRQWGLELRRAGQNWKVWTELDYESGFITNEIAAISDLAVIGQIPRAA